MMALKSRSFTVPQRVPSSTAMRLVLEHCIQQALANEPVSQDSINAAIGSANTCGSTATGILNRLEAPTNGDHPYIRRKQFQRGVQVYVIDADLWTAPPPCTVPHWRTITDRMPVPAIQQVRQRDQSLAAWIESQARTLGRDYLDFATELLRRGAQDYRADQESPL